MKYSKEIIEKYYDSSAKDLVDAGICPTCFDRATDRHLFGDNDQNIIFCDEDIECLFVANPRAPGHAIISTKQHFHDMSEATDEVNKKIICFAKQLMIAIKEAYGCERVYFCTMSDGPMNHYHVQLIPRYATEERGSKNFVKPRGVYVYDKEKLEKVKNIIENFAKNYK